MRIEINICSFLKSGLKKTTLNKAGARNPVFARGSSHSSPNYVSYADPPRRCVWPSHLAVEEGMEHRERVGWLVARDLKKTVRWEGQAVIMLAG